MKYRMRIIREVEFEITIEAPSKENAIRMVYEKALDYDDRDLKSTKIVSVYEEDPVFNTSFPG